MCLNASVSITTVRMEICSLSTTTTTTTTTTTGSVGDALDEYRFGTCSYAVVVPLFVDMSSSNVNNAQLILPVSSMQRRMKQQEQQQHTSIIMHTSNFI